MNVAVGVDCGGSTTRLAVRDGDGGVLVLRGARGNVAERGPGPVARTIVGLLKRALGRRDVSTTAGGLLVGAAGVGSGPLRRALAERLQGALPGMDVTVVTDAELALVTAFADGPGLAVIVGTGTALFTRTPAGTIESGGGWGPLAGDVGGGYWLARHLLAHVADAFDELAPRDEAVERFLAATGVTDRDTFKLWLRGAAGRRQAVAAVAPLVLDGVARAEAWPCWLCSQAAGAIGRLAGALSRRVGHGKGLLAVLVGGVIEGAPRYRDLVVERLAAEAGIHVVALPRPPVEGALLRAEATMKRCTP